MEKLTTIQEARLKCLQMANDYANQSPTSKTDAYEFHLTSDKVILLADEYLNYVLSGNKNQTQKSS